MYLPKYSICMTCFNEVSTVRDSLNSLLGQVNGDYEVVVVDNYSSDGTYEALREFEKSHGVKVIQRKCSRGRGRQVAFENSSGEYIIANMDLDDVFLPVLDGVVTRYHQRVEGKIMALFNSRPPPDMSTGWVQNITIGPRDLIASIGGWRDLNVFEDWDLWSRANRTNRYCWSSFKFTANDTLHPETKSSWGRLTERYGRYRNRLLLGMKIFSKGEKIGLSQRLAYWGARLSLISRRPLEGQDPNFDSLAEGLFVDLGNGKSSPGTEDSLAAGPA